MDKKRQQGAALLMVLVFNNGKRAASNQRAGVYVPQTKRRAELNAQRSAQQVLSLLALNEGIAPPTIGLEQEDEVCRLNYVKGTAQKLDSDYALSNSFGFGGHNSCLVLKRGR